MRFSVVTNVQALAAHRALTWTNDTMHRSLERLSSGSRINRPADDAAGLAISQNLRLQVSGMGQAIRNTQDGINVVRTADGALGSATDILRRIGDLAVQAANDGMLDAPAKRAVQEEMAELKAKLSRIGADDVVRASTVTAAVSDEDGVPTAGRVVVAGDYTTGGVYPATFAALAGSITYTARRSTWAASTTPAR